MAAGRRKTWPACTGSGCGLSGYGPGEYAAPDGRPPPEGTFDDAVTALRAIEASVLPRAGGEPHGREFDYLM
ncbi:MAG TPA: hypothetical protein VMH35_13430 [Streptosporangiaceae bacterium]|nr:hypothetical protein [Streptosporangiaceae bacterium]